MRGRRKGGEGPWNCFFEVVAWLLTCECCHSRIMSSWKSLLSLMNAKCRSSSRLPMKIKWNHQGNCKLRFGIICICTTTHGENGLDVPLHRNIYCAVLLNANTSVRPTVCVHKCLSLQNYDCAVTSCYCGLITAHYPCCNFLHVFKRKRGLNLMVMISLIEYKFSNCRHKLHEISQNSTLWLH